MKKLILLTFAIFLFTQSNAQNWILDQKVVASDRAYYDNYGYSVSISGNIAVIGSPHEDEDENGLNYASGAGSAYIYEKGTIGNWIQVQKIVALDRDGGDQFGWSVDVSGDYIIVGATYESHDTSGNNKINKAGSAYIFERGTNGIWSQVQKIVASHRITYDEFGWAVSIKGDYVIVGVPKEDEDANGMNYESAAGSAYIFKRGSMGIWSQVQKIVPNIRGGGSKFGTSVCLNENNIICGATGESLDSSGLGYIAHAGSAYIFSKNSSGIWSQVKRIVPSDLTTSSGFGNSVSIDSNYVIIGAEYQSASLSGVSYTGVGSAYIYKKSLSGNWNYYQKIIASDRSIQDRFGISVSINGRFIVVGAYQDSDDANGANPLTLAGSAYIFENNMNGQWVQVEKIVAFDRETLYNFGYSVSVDGKSVIVGSFNADLRSGYTLSGKGASYIYEKLSTGISENDFNLSCIYYPNPTSGNITVDLGKTYDRVDLMVSNTLGQVVLSKSYKSTNNLSFEIKESSGVYFVEIRTDEGKSAVLKVIKE